MFAVLQTGHGKWSRSFIFWVLGCVCVYVCLPVFVCVCVICMWHMHLNMPVCMPIYAFAEARAEHQVPSLVILCVCLEIGSFTELKAHLLGYVESQ